MSTTPADRRDDVVQLLSDAPEGLSDSDLARGLGAGVRPQTVNALCRRMAAAGVVERVGTRPIRNRLVAAASGPTPAPSSEDVISAEPAEPAEPAEMASADPAPADETSGEDDRSGAADTNGHLPAGADPAAEPDPSALVTRDALQAWSRAVNVQAAVAHWLRERGATLRSVPRDRDGAARELVAQMDGSDLRVEVTGWPTDGDRTHPTTLAADWFSAASRAAGRRRRAHPQARIVIALPDTRRYRALAAADREALAVAGAEVWFVDHAGEIDPDAAGVR